MLSTLVVVLAVIVAVVMAVVVMAVAEVEKVCLLLFYVLATSKVISGPVPTCDSALWSGQSLLPASSAP